MVPGSLITLRYLPLHRLVTGPVWSQGFLYLSPMGPQCPSVVVRRLPSVRRSSLGCGPPRSLSLLRLFGLCLGALLSAPSSFSTCGLLSARPFGLSLSPLGFFFSAGNGFLPSLHGRSVAFSSCSTALAYLRGPGESFPELFLFCAFGLPLFGSLPSCPVPQVSLPPGGCLLPWIGASAMCALASSSGARFPGVLCSVVCLRSRSPLCCLSSGFHTPSSVSPPSVSPAVVFLRGLHDGVTLARVECQFCVLPLDRNEGFTCRSRLYSFGMGSPFGSSVFCIHS